jgi:hypothetical protein
VSLRPPGRGTSTRRADPSCRSSIPDHSPLPLTTPKSVPFSHFVQLAGKVVLSAVGPGRALGAEARDCRENADCRPGTYTVSFNGAAGCALNYSKRRTKGDRPARACSITGRSTAPGLGAGIGQPRGRLDKPCLPGVASAVVPAGVVVAHVRAGRCARLRVVPSGGAVVAGGDVTVADRDRSGGRSR